MSKHPNKIKGYSSMKTLAQDVENLNYCHTAKFLDELALALFKRARDDKAAGREMLASELGDASAHILRAYHSMYRAFKICEPYMSEERKTHTFHPEDGVGPALCLYCGMKEKDWDGEWECGGQ